MPPYAAGSLTTSATIWALEAADGVEFGTSDYLCIDLQVGAERDTKGGCGEVYEHDASVDVLALSSHSAIA
jgi:hypothetical protein